MARRIGDRNRQRERALQHAMMVRYATRVERAMAREVSKTTRTLFDARLEGQPGSDVVIAHRENIRRIVTAGWTETAMAFGDRIMDALGKRSSLAIERKNRDSLRERLQAWLQDEIGSRPERIAATTLDQVTGLVQRAMDRPDGVSMDQIARQLRQAIPQLSNERAFTIARTEIHTASQGAQLESAAESQLDMEKEWISSLDDRVRDEEFDHAVPDGQVVGRDELFEVSGEMMRYPGDPSASAGNVIHCRCGTAYLVR